MPDNERLVSLLLVLSLFRDRRRYCTSAAETLGASPAPNQKLLAPGSPAEQVNIRASDPFVLNFCRLFLLFFREAATHREERLMRVTGVKRSSLGLLTNILDQFRASRVVSDPCCPVVCMGLVCYRDIIRTPLCLAGWGCGTRPRPCLVALSKVQRSLGHGSFSPFCAESFAMAMLSSWCFIHLRGKRTTAWQGGFQGYWSKTVVFDNHEK